MKLGVTGKTGRRCMLLPPGPGNCLLAPGWRRRWADDDDFLHAACGITELHKELFRL
jgi:hypothetical protein